MAPRSILITGCSKDGLGSELAFAFQKAGLKVYATARTTSKIDPALVKLPNVTVLQLDVVSKESIDAAVKAVEADSGKLDILLNNSGQGMINPFMDSDLEDARRLFDVNVWAVCATNQAFLPLLIKSKGTIINHCSISAYIALPYSAFYSASKAALVSLSDTMRLELAPLGVKVVALNTGAVKSQFFSNITAPELPTDSLYKPAEKEFQLMSAGVEVQRRGMLAKTYAERAVRDIIGGETRAVWRGKFASTVKYLYGILPFFIVDRLSTPNSGLEKI